MDCEAARTAADCACRWNGKVTTCSRAQVQTAGVLSDQLTHGGKIIRRQVVQTDKHCHAQFKVYTLPDQQPMQNVTYGGKDVVVLPLANDQSSCSIENSLELPPVDAVYASDHCITVIDPTDDQCVHEGSDSVRRQHSSD